MHCRASFLFFFPHLHNFAKFCIAYWEAQICIISPSLSDVRSPLAPVTLGQVFG